ncbi:N-acyl-L-amino acid amidohydrolase [Variibacter gotjawalensis]|uniref:N-acyl-L-amino acid amidohydrolase n=1 Tax=Variibacter gotjawalensis TaxID=1333996 RepID=A0A0S3PW06_9BRAD|nr:amidohydrolase [Variibacter gotjawalensis]NIK45939.1 amidohydrolase [Variibacter gotjawalensis]BAT60113.1 N-acyl-L-amino acid amidohydrolase [Variibacter gotjawalensis]
MSISKPAQGQFIAEAVEPISTAAALPGCVCAACGLVVPPTGPTVAPTSVARPIHAQLDAAAAAIEARMIAWRRDFHAHPELGNQETRTAGIVADHLKRLGYQVHERIATTGVVGLLKGEGGEGPVVALRADMDALPVAEEVDLPFASKVTTQWGGETVGVMHACGHDCHVAVLMAVAEVLAELRGEWRGTVKLIFQPAEEGLPIGESGGARVMVEQGAMIDPKPDVVFGLHVTSAMPVGVISYKAGVTMAASDTFRITVKGSQTHGAMPWKGVDPVTIGSTIVTTLQTIVSRESDINRNPAVVTVGQFKGGQRQNIISDKAELLGTARTYSDDHRGS